MTSGKHIKKALAIEDVEIEFISLVDRPANKRKFLIVKQEGGQRAMKNVNLEDFKAVLSEMIAATIIEALSELGIIGDDGETASNVRKSQEHYLQGIL
jgi:hypothetical protein